ncbi:hypothetical protein FB451DRAFT_1190181 [Mycena latifolia]|nr:hypothetical protein FB451DRAFT_1190181 [Mycena latifolia]
MSRAPNTRSRGNSAAAAPAAPLPANATPANVASSRYPDKGPAKRKTPISSLHFNKTPSNTYTGSSVKGKARAFAIAHPDARSSNSFEPLSALEEHTTEEINVADPTGIPVASMVGGGSISSPDLSNDSISAPITSTPPRDFAKELARKLDARARASSAPSSAPVSPSTAPPVATTKLSLSPFLDPVGSAEDAPSASTTATGTPAGSPSAATTANAPVGATNPATTERTTAPAACTTAAATDTSTPVLPAVALPNPASKALPSVALANLKESPSNDLAADTSSTGAPLAPTPSASTLAPATTAPQAATSSTFPQATPDPDDARAAAANEFDSALTDAQTAQRAPPSQAARARADCAAAQLLASIALRATTPSIVQPAASLPGAAAAGTTPSFAAAVIAPRPTTRSQPRGPTAQPAAGAQAAAQPVHNATPHIVHAAQPAVPHASGAAAATVHANTANPAPTAPPPAATNANPVNPAPTAAPASSAHTSAASPAPGAAPASAAHMSAVNPAPSAAPTGATNANVSNPAPGAPPAGVANANANAVIHAPVSTPIGTAAVAAPVGTTITLYTTPPPGGFQLYGWDEKTVREGISDRHLAKWDAPGAPKAFVYEWNAKRHDPKGTTVEDIKTAVSCIFGCPAPLVGPAEPAVASTTSGGPYVYLMKGLTTAQFKALVDALCWSVAGGKTLFVIPYSPNPCPFLMTLEGLLFDDSPQAVVDVATLVAETIMGAFDAQNYLALVNDAYPAGTPPMAHFVSTIRVVAIKYDGLVAWNVTAQPPSLLVDSNHAWVSVVTALTYFSEMHANGTAITPPLRCGGCRSLGHIGNDCPLRLIPGWNENTPAANINRNSTTAPHGRGRGGRGGGNRGARGGNRGRRGRGNV